MSKTGYVVVEKSYFYTDEYFADAGSGMPRRIFDTLEDAQKQVDALNVDACRSGYIRPWDTEVGFEEHQAMHAALSELIGEPVTNDLWDLEMEILGRVSDQAILRFLD